MNQKLAIAYQKAVSELIPDEVGDTDDALLIINNYVLNDDGEILVAVRQEFSTYDGIRSAVAHLYSATGVIISFSFQASMSLYIKGSKRLNAMAKQMLGLDLSEGKKPMSRKVYKRICENLFRSPKPEHLFGHLFFVLDW